MNFKKLKTRFRNAFFATEVEQELTKTPVVLPESKMEIYIREFIHFLTKSHTSSNLEFIVLSRNICVFSLPEIKSILHVISKNDIGAYKIQFVINEIRPYLSEQDFNELKNEFKDFFTA